MNQKHLSMLLAAFMLLQYVICDNVEHKDCSSNTPANSTVTLACPLESDVSWQKVNGNASMKVEDGSKYTIYENNTLVIKKVGEDCSGVYTCNNSAETTTFTVCVLPFVKPYDKPKNVIEGDPFQTECVAWGYPAVSVKWTRITKDSSTEQDIIAGDNVILKDGSCINSTLRIQDVKNEDAGFYICHATNSLGDSANVTLSVNVKDKLAALWPFLGICAEVAILCIIIFFYERRRAKRLDKEAASEEADRMNVNNDAKISEDVRHRK